jgi:hypothetical protein
MNKLFLIVNLIFFAPNLFSQFNKDSDEIKAQNIKSITFSNEALCKFDTEGRLIEYVSGDINQKLEESDIPHGQIYLFTVDTIGNFTYLIGLDYNQCEESNCDPDTVCYQFWKFTGTDLDSSYGWEYTETSGEKSNRDFEACIYSSKLFGDTLMEKLYTFNESKKSSEIQIKFTIKLKPNKILYFEAGIPNRYLFTDSAKFFLDSLNYGYRTIIYYSKKGIPKKSIFINSNGDSTAICSRFKELNDHYSCICETPWGRKESSLSKKVLGKLSSKIRVEQNHLNEFTLSPSLFLVRDNFILEIEYYK